MKKLFAIVMVLAMALAIAAPALASGWDELPTEAPATKDITIKITALETEKNTSVIGSLYEQLKVMYPVVKGTVVHFFVEIGIPALANRSAATKNLLAKKGLDYELYLSNLELTSANAYENGADKGARTVAPNADKGSDDSILFGSTGVAIPDTAIVYGYEYWAKGVQAGKDGVVAASIGFYNVWKTGVFGWDSNADGNDEFTVTHNAGSFVIVKAGTTASSILFPVVEPSGKIDTTKQILLGYGTDEFAVTRAVNGDITFRNTATNYVFTPGDTTGVTYAALKAAFDAYFAALGFPYEDAKYMTEAHFAKYFGTISETSVKITYPSGAVVVSPPSVEPPQTGDAGTLVGFVMIALALVAAAAVTVKKVRA